MGFTGVVMTDPVVAIETVGLVKRFGRTLAVDGVDLQIRRGHVFSLLGPNGAGKTTTVRMLATLTRPDAGVARVMGHDVVDEADAVRRRVRLTGQNASVDVDLSGIENLSLLARLAGYGWRAARVRAGALLEAFGLAHDGGRLVRGYSGGMRRRLDIAASLVTTPDVLFLDEPTSGLDPQSRQQVWELIRALTANGTTVLLTTQHLDEADRLSDRVAVIDRGRVVAEGTPTQLKTTVGTGVLSVHLLDAGQAAEAEAVLTRALQAPVRLDHRNLVLAIAVSDPRRATGALEALEAHGIAVGEFALGRPSLDEVFTALTQRDGEAQDVVARGNVA